MTPGRLRLAFRVTLAAAAVIGGLSVLGAPPTSAAAAPQPAEPERGRQLFLTGCSTCHGVDGKGTSQGPTLAGVGAASADFYLSTGRMPLSDPRSRAERKRPRYDPDDIAALTRYVASLGPGADIPRIDPAGADLARGADLYTANCAACHSAAGAGGAIGKGLEAPSLHVATTTQIEEAIRIGPGSMPVFGPETLDDAQVAAITRYVLYLAHPDDRGGASLGRLGPIPEGFVAWLFGLGLLLLATRWIGERERE